MTGPRTARAVQRRDFALWLALAVAFCGFVALGLWQLQRLAWKNALVARVEARVHAAPEPPPMRARWADVNDIDDGYRRIRLVGRYLPVREARTQAVTELGAGAWALAPLRTTGGDIVFVNRGFVPAGARATPVPAGEVTVIGLLRLGEPGGGFLRRNDPAAERWYSRDVVAIGRARGLPAEAVAPFFVDAEAAAAASSAWPRGGLTVVRFRNAHLSYALTWFGMALLTAVAATRLVVAGRGLRQDHGGTIASDAEGSPCSRER